MVIGLTGGLASGKSTVSRWLKRLGAVVIDADQVARQVVEPGQPALAEIRQRFGPEVLDANGSLNRQELGRRVFADAATLVELNGITHPHIIRRIEERVRAERQRDAHQVVVVDAPLLLEAGLDVITDEVWVVATQEETQVRRAVARDNITPEEAQRRIASQMPLTEKLAKAQRVINGDLPLAEMEKQVISLWRQIRGRH